MPGAPSSILAPSSFLLLLVRHLLLLAWHLFLVASLLLVAQIGEALVFGNSERPRTPCRALDDRCILRIGAKCTEGSRQRLTGLDWLGPSTNGARTLLVARCIATRSKDATRGAPGPTTRNKKLLGTKAFLLGARTLRLGSGFLCLLTHIGSPKADASTSSGLAWRSAQTRRIANE